MGEEDEVIIEEVPKEATTTEENKAAEEDVGAGEEEGEEDNRSPADKALDLLEEEKSKMTPLEQLERSLLWKVEGNDFFKKGELFKAADCYYHSIIFARDLTKNPQHYPELKHTSQEMTKAKELCESVFTNLALVQLKYGCSLSPENSERCKVLEEGVKSASQALKLNANNVKALYRRAATNAVLAKSKSNSEAQELCAEVKADLLNVIEAEPQNKEARAELKAVQEHLRQLKREEREGEKREFSFASTLSGLGFKEKDLLGDGSIRKQQVSAGDGGKWLNEDWLDWTSRTKCVLHVAVSSMKEGKKDSSVNLSFILGDPDMHEGVNLAVKSMTQGEVANFTFAQHRLVAQSGLTRLLPKVQEESCWQIEFQKFVTWEDLDRNGERLRKIQEEGYGVNLVEELSEVFVHWRLIGPDNKLIHSTRYTVQMSDGQGMQQVEDEDKAAPSFIVGESAWPPVAALCRSLRQGGVGELRLKDVPELPQDPNGDDVSVKLSLMMNRGSTGSLSHCTVKVELEKVVPAVTGPEDARWQGAETLLQERFHAERLLEQGYEQAALARLRRVVTWAEQLSSNQATSLQEDVALARTAIGWACACRAAPILDSGSVSSDVLKAARKDMEEAEEHCSWLESHNHAGARLLRAKILVVNDDNFAAAHLQLLEAQKLLPEDKRVQEELQKVKIELRKEEEQQSRAKVAEIRDALKKARTENRDGADVLPLLKQLSETRCSWETVMETRIGVELKNCQDCGEGAKQLCQEILARMKDESKEQRPMWES